MLHLGMVSARAATTRARSTSSISDCRCSDSAIAAIETAGSAESGAATSRRTSAPGAWSSGLMGCGSSVRCGGWTGFMLRQPDRLPDGRHRSLSVRSRARGEAAGDLYLTDPEGGRDWLPGTAPRVRAAAAVLGPAASAASTPGAAAGVPRSLPPPALRVQTRTAGRKGGVVGGGAASADGSISGLADLGYRHLVTEQGGGLGYAGMACRSWASWAHCLLILRASSWVWRGGRPWPAVVAKVALQVAGDGGNGEGQERHLGRVETMAGLRQRQAGHLGEVVVVLGSVGEPPSETARQPQVGHRDLIDDAAAPVWVCVLGWSQQCGGPPV